MQGHPHVAPVRIARSRIAAAAVLVLAAVPLALAQGCRRGGDEQRSGAPADNLRRYTVRGEVTHVSVAKEPRKITLRHEAVPDFQNESGATVGMPPMVMPFDVAPGLPLDGVRAGDKVEVRFAVGWSPPVVRVEQITKLPGDVQLRFGEP